jgi:hypothetical protein
MITKCFLQVQSHTIKYKLRKIIEKRERERETPHSISANILTAWKCSYTTNQNKDSNHPFKNDMKSKTRSTIHLTLTTRIHLQYIHYYHKPFPTGNGALFISLKVRANHKLMAKCSILQKKKIHL